MSFWGIVRAGNVSVGNSACVGANAFVLNDVPDGYVAFTEPAESRERKKD